MSYDQVPAKSAKSHSLSMEGRESLHLSGVEDVSGFDESLVILRTSLGALNIRGEALHIGKIDLEAGELELSGKIQELSYDEVSGGGSLWSRLFG